MAIYEGLQTPFLAAFLEAFQTFLKELHCNFIASTIFPLMEFYSPR